MKHLKIKWNYNGRTYYGTANYYNNFLDCIMIVFVFDEHELIFDRIDIEDVDDDITELDRIWMELEDRARTEEDGILDVTNLWLKTLIKGE